MTAIKRSLFADDFNQKFLLIDEVHGSVAADFLLSSIISDQFQRNPNAGMCLLLFHNTFSHYNNICSRNNSKLNLADLVQNDQIICIQGMESVLKEFNEEKVQSPMEDLGSFFFNEVEKAINKLIEKNVSHTFLVIEGVSNLFYSAQNLKNVMNFVQSCYNRVLNLSASTLVVSSHTCDTNSDQKLLLAFLKHLANIYIRVSGLKTGFSSDVSGNFVIEKKTDSLYDFDVHKDKFFFKLEESSAVIYDGVAPSFLK